MKDVFLNCYIITDYDFNMHILCRKHMSLKKREHETVCMIS